MNESPTLVSELTSSQRGWILDARERGLTTTKMIRMLSGLPDDNMNAFAIVQYLAQHPHDTHLLREYTV